VADEDQLLVSSSVFRALELAYAAYGAGFVERFQLEKS